MTSDYMRGYNSGYIAGRRAALGMNKSGHVCKFRVSKDQSDTGTAGVRKACTCGRTRTDYNPELHALLAQTVAPSERATV